MTLQDEIRRRREANLPPLTAEEQRQFQQNLTDTAAVDARMSEIGSTKTTMKGAKIVNGAYKGLTPGQAAQAAMTGAMPPGKFRPGAMGRMTGSLTGDSLYGPQAPRIAPPPTAAPAPAPAPVSPSLPVPQSQSLSSAAPVSAAQSLLTIPALGAKPPLAPAPAAAAPRAPGLINGQAAPQFFQEAANRQGISNSYGTIKPQAAPAIAPAAAPAAPMSAAPRPLDPALKEPRGFTAGPVAKPTAGVTPPAQDKLTPLIQSTQAMITQARTPATMPPSPTATRNGPPLVGLSAPKWQPATPVDGSGIADTMKNNQMIRPNFAQVAAATPMPLPAAAQPLPPAAPPPVQPRIAPFGTMPKMIASSAPTSLAGIEARAAGGPVQAGKPYLVGEKGPELIVPQKSGTVVPNHDLPKTYVRDHAKGPGAMKPKEPRAAPTVPKTAKEATKMGLQDAVLGLQAIGQSAVNAIVPDSVLQGKQQRAAEDQAYRNDVNQARDAFDGGGGVGGFLTEAAVRLPGNIINTAAEVYSPSNKIAAATAGYHGVRKYAETGDATQAGIAAASNLIGERLRNKAGPVLKSIISKWPSNLAGNAAGSVLEKVGGSALDAWRSGAAPATTRPPPAKPRPTLTAPVIAAAPRIAPYGPMPKMLSSSPARPAKSLQPPQLVMSR